MNVRSSGLETLLAANTARCPCRFSRQHRLLNQQFAGRTSQDYEPGVCRRGPIRDYQEREMLSKKESTPMKIRLATQGSESAHTTPSASGKTRIRVAREKAWLRHLADGQAARKPEDFRGDRTPCGKQACSSPPPAVLPAAARSAGYRTEAHARDPRPPSTVAANVETADRIFRSCLLPWTLIRRSRFADLDLPICRFTA